MVGICFVASGLERLCEVHGSTIDNQFSSVDTSYLFHFVFRMVVSHKNGHSRGGF